MTPRDHNSEIGLLSAIAVGVIVLTAIGHFTQTTDRPFDPSAYLVVLTLIVGAIKERWTQRSVDRLGDQMGQTANQTAAASAALVQTVAASAPPAPVASPLGPDGASNGPSRTSDPA